MNRRRLILVNRYFHPDHSATSQLATDLARHLASREWEVIAIAGRQLYDRPDASLPRLDSFAGVEILRAWSTRFGRRSLPGRAVDYLTFAWSAFLLLIRRARRGTIIVAMTDPPLLSVVAAVAATLRRAVLVNWIQDLFPDVAEALGVVKRRRWLHALRDWSLRCAATNVAVGELMAERVRTIGATAAVRHNWADASIEPVPHDQNPLRAEWNLDGKFVVAYSGNLGRAHDLETITGAVRMLASEPSIVFLFIGGGAQLETVKRDTEGLPNVAFRPYQPRERLRYSLSAADAHLVSLQPSLEGLIVPSKAYGALAAGRPILYIGSRDGEIPSVLGDASGSVIAPGDSSSLAETIRAWAREPERAGKIGSNGRAESVERYSAPVALERWSRILEPLAPPSHP